jgi:hypothetical protein
VIRKIRAARSPRKSRHHQYTAVHRRIPVNPTEQRYTGAARLMQGLAAIKHLTTGAGPDIRRAFEDLVDAATGEEASAREANLIENDWAYGEAGPSPLMHPDYTDPSKRRAVIVGIIDAEEADLHVETVGPFPMAVEDPTSSEEGTATVIVNEGELLEHFHALYGGAMTTIRPMPCATAPDKTASTGDETDNQGRDGDG